MSVATRYATQTRPSSNLVKSPFIIRMGTFLVGDMNIMKLGHFYFLINDYFVDFPDPYLMQNREIVSGQDSDRPCFYAFADSLTQIYWMIPFSSKVEKYRNIYQKKRDRSGRCDTILFGEVLGYEKAFLIQNMCPITLKYIKNEYIDNIANIPVRLDGVFEKNLIQKANMVLILVRQGKNLVFPDILRIEKELKIQLSKDT